MKDLIPTERIEHTILLIRGHKVILDVDLAKLYGVTTFNLNKRSKKGDRLLCLGHRTDAARGALDRPPAVA